MEGNLLKWANYWHGWQPRWFVLKDGVFSYCNSQSDSQNGAFKRSYKISMLDIIVHKQDNTRIDLIIADDQHICLKACDYRERQKWLVALASQKATYPTMSMAKPPANPQANIPTPEEASSATAGASATTSTSSNNSAIHVPNIALSEATNLLRIKKSELQLYCDLLTQQSHEMKNLMSTISSTYSTSTAEASSGSSVDKGESDDSKTTTSKPTEDSTPENIKKLDDMTSNINATCDMLISIIRNVIVLSNTSTNVGPAAISAILNESTPPNSASSSFMDSSNQQYLYHLYHPLYTNNQLTQHKKSSPKSDSASANNENKAIFNPYHSLYPLPGNLYTPFNDLLDLSSSSIPGPLEQFNNQHLFDRDIDSHNSSLNSSQESAAALRAALKALQDNKESSNEETAENSINFFNTHANTTSPKSRLTSKPIAISSNKNFNSFNSNTTRDSKYKERFGNLPYVHKSNQPLKDRTNYRNFHSPIPIMNASAIGNYSLQSLKQTSLLAHVETEQTVEGENAQKVQSISELYLTATVIESDQNQYQSISSSSKQTTTGFFDENCQNNLDRENQQPVSQSERQELQSSEPNTVGNEINFFSMIITKFSDFRVCEKDEIACDEFLKFCSEIFFLIDKFGSSAFIPVKIDVYGNIDKLRQRYAKNPTKFYSIQAIIQHEIDESQISVKNSATLSLLWLKRAIAFLREFLDEFVKAENPDVSACVHASYQKTLKPHHNWVVRSIFSLAVRSVPSKDTFLRGLADDDDCFVSNKELFEVQVKQSMKVLVGKLDVLIGIINDFYDKNDLERQLQ